MESPFTPLLLLPVSTPPGNPMAPDPHSDHPSSALSTRPPWSSFHCLWPGFLQRPHPGLPLHLCHPLVSSPMGARMILFTPCSAQTPAPRGSHAHLWGKPQASRGPKALQDLAPATCLPLWPLLPHPHPSTQSRVPSRARALESVCLDAAHCLQDPLSNVTMSENPSLPSPSPTSPGLAPASALLFSPAESPSVT